MMPLERNAATSQFFPLPSTVTRDRGSVSKAQAEQILDELTARFGTSRPNLHWSKTRGGTYYLGREEIHFGPNSYRGVDVLLHEFSHHLQKIKKYTELAPQGTIVERWSYACGEKVQSYRRSIHGPDFFLALFDVASVAYGNFHHYSWDQEYSSIAKKYARRYGRTTTETQAWSALVKEIIRLDGMVPPKGKGWTDSIRAEAARLGISSMVPIWGGLR